MSFHAVKTPKQCSGRHEFNVHWDLILFSFLHARAKLISFCATRIVFVPFSFTLTYVAIKTLLKFSDQTWITIKLAYLRYPLSCQAPVLDW